MDIKICGLKTIKAVDAVIANIPRGATHVGFIFFARSPRFISPADAAPLAARAKGAGLTPVAVTVDADEAFLAGIVDTVKPGMIQLHGKESPEQAHHVQVHCGLPVMKVISVSSASDFQRAKPYHGLVERFMFDAKPPKGSELPGGNAVSFDWKLLKQVPDGLDYLLAGGINAGNVAAAMSVNPPGLDASSGLESAPGVKDPALIHTFFDAVENARG